MVNVYFGHGVIGTDPTVFKIVGSTAVAEAVDGSAFISSPHHAKSMSVGWHPTWS